MTDGCWLNYQQDWGFFPSLMCPYRLRNPLQLSSCSVGSGDLPTDISAGS